MSHRYTLNKNHGHNLMLTLNVRVWSDRHTFISVMFLDDLQKFLFAPCSYVTVVIAVFI